MLDGIEIRKPLPTELRELSQLACATFLEAYGSDNLREKLLNYCHNHFSEVKMEEYLKDPKHSLLVAKHRGELIAYAKFGVVPFQNTALSPKAVHLDKLYVRQKYQSNGLGITLLNQVILEAKKAGNDSICLNVWIHNRKAMHFYAQLGFQRVGDILFALTPNDREINYLYAKDLTPAVKTPLHIRPILEKDNAALANIIRQIMPQYGAGGPGFAIHDQEVNEMFASYSQPRSAYFVVEREDKVLGGAGIGPLPETSPNVCELKKMYFLPEIKGLGLGRTLLELCLKEAKALGYTLCYIETFHSMEHAQKLYERSGFTKRSSSLGNTGHFACDVWYEKNL